MNQHQFVGAGNRCLHQVFGPHDRAVHCGQTEDHPIHHMNDDERETARRMFESRRDYRDIELGNPTLRDGGV